MTEWNYGYTDIKRLSLQPLVRSLILPWILILFVFSPVLTGRIPVNFDWLAAGHYPWKIHSPAHVQNPDIDDPAIQFYPLACRAAGVLKHGRIPLWNPDIGCGCPQLADFISQPLDPIFLLSIAITPAFPLAWAMLLLMQQLVLSVAAAGFLLARKCSVTGASIGSTAVLFCAPVVCWMELRRPTASFIGLFLALWAIETARLRSPGRLIYAGMAMAYGALAGHPQFTLYTWCICFLYFAYRHRQEQRPAVMVSRMLLLLGITCFLCAPSVLPQMELLHNATRGELGRYFSMFRFGAAQWLSLLIPDVLGHPESGNYFGTYIYFRSFTTLPILYFGALPLTMILLAARRQPAGQAFFVGLPAGLLAILTLAGLKPIRLFLQDHCIGLFNTDPGRSAVMVSILLAVWSGEAASHVFKSEPCAIARRSLRVLTPAAVITAGVTLLSMGLYLFRAALETRVQDNSFLLFLLTLQDQNGAVINSPSVRRMVLMFVLAGLVIWMSGYFNRRRFLPLVAAGLVMAADLVPWAVRFNPFVSPDRLSLPDSSMRTLDGHRDPMNRSTAMDSPGSCRPESEVFPPNSLLLNNLPDFRLYTSTPLKISSRLIQHVQSRTYWDRTINQSVKPLLDLAAVRWIYTSPDYVPDRPDLLLSEQLDDLNVFVSSGAVPRLRLTGCHRSNAGDRTGADAMDVEDEIWGWLERQPERFIGTTIVYPDAAEPVLDDIPDVANGNVLEVAWSDCLIRSVVMTGTPALVVLSDVWYPGWTAEVNGQEISILKANGMFRAVPVPAGRSVVVMTYQPVSYRLGVFMMLLAVMLSGAALKGMSMWGNRP